ncbi:MAG: DHH family phosphoesterase, partial [Clostridia bacterium]
DCSYPFKELAGVGVAFKLIQALEGKDNAQTIVDTYSDMVCLGTIADVVPLLGENRLIVSAGLQKMSNINTSNMGLQALIKISALKEKKITAGMVGFIVAPRINAAGRIGSALRAVELFLTESEIVADEISAELNEENRNRQAEEAQILQEALKLVEDLNLSQRKVIVLSGENWHHGVIGIVASRITDKFYRPSILISLEGNEGKGSGRSISGFNLFKALNVCEEDLIKFGGHELAAGLSIEKQKIADFNEHIIKYAEQNLNEDDLIPRIKIDYEINVESLKIDTIKQIEVLAPFGMGNASPIFCFSHADITDIKTVGDNKHLKIRLEKDGCSIDAIGFNMGEYGQHFINGDVVDIACSLDVNSYNGNEKVQLIIKDIKLTDDQIKEYEYFKHLYSYINEKPQCDFSKFQWSEQIFNSVIPKRQDFIIVYQYIKTRSLNDTYSDNEFLLHRRIAKSYNVPMNFLKVKNCLDVFQELGLLDYSICDEKITIYLYDNKGEKVNIESSRKLVNLKKMKERLIQ